MNSKKDWKKLKVTFLVIDIVLLVLAILIGSFCAYRLVGINQLKNNGYTETMEKLDQEETRIRADMVKHIYKHLVRLSINLGELNRDQFYFVENPCREEIGGRIETVENLPFVAFHHRLQLVHVAHQ